MIIDAHQDIAYDAWALGRDFLLGAHEKRAREATSDPRQSKDICTVGLPDMQAGGIGLCFGSIFTETAKSTSQRPGFTYTTPTEAHAQALWQLSYYDRLVADARLLPIKSRSDLEKLRKARSQHPTVGLLVELEGADPVLSPADVFEWQARGVRQIGLAWAYGSRYCGGNKEPGPLTSEGKEILRAMERAGLILDVSHLAEESFWQALDVFHGLIVASHSNCRALVPGERQLSDNMIRTIVERNGMIGIVIYNRFLKAGWEPAHGKQAVTLRDVVRHIDHICQLAGNCNHVGIGSDLDGGYGAEATPAEIDTVADLQLLGPALTAGGYPDHAVAAILGDNWLDFLQHALP